MTSLKKPNLVALLQRQHSLVGTENVPEEREEETKPTRLSNSADVLGQKKASAHSICAKTLFQSETGTKFYCPARVYLIVYCPYRMRPMIK